MRFRIPQVLSERPVRADLDDVMYFINRELLPVLRGVLRVLTGVPVTFAWSSGAATVDLSVGRDFASSNTLTENTVLTLSNGYEGAEGTIYVQQDAVGGHTVTVVAPGRTTLREDPFLDDNPAAGAGDLTQYHYTFMTIAGTGYVVLERTYLR